MNILLIIIGGILFVFCGIMTLSTHTALKNQENWDSFYKTIEEKNLSVPEEVVYKLVSKMNFWFSLFTVIGMLLMAGGILLQTLK